MFDPAINPESEGPSLNNLHLPASGPRIELPEHADPHTLSIQDKHTLAEIYKRCFEAAPWNETWSAADAAAQIEKYLAPDVNMIVLREQGQVVGMIVGMSLSAYKLRNPADATRLESYVSGADAFYLADFTVDASMQGLGLGNRLIRALVQFAERSAYESIVTRTRIDNLSALHVFTQNGFLSQGIYAATTGGVQSDRTVLCRKL